MSTRLILITFLLAIFLFSAAAVFMSIPGVHASGGGPSTVATSTSNAAARYSYQDKSFYADGLFWVFYSDGTNLAYSTSSTGTSWTVGASSPIRACTAGNDFSIWFDGTYVYYAYTANSVDTAMYYRVGTPTSSGSITWIAAEQTAIAAVSSVTYSNPYVSVDSAGHAWISYDYYTTSITPYVTESASTASGAGGGTWGTTPSGFPHQLSSTAESGWMSATIPLTSGNMLVIYAGNGVYLYADEWSGTSWGTPITSAYEVANSEFFGAVANGNNVNIAYTTSAYAIQYMQYIYSSNSFSAGATLESGASANYAPVISMDPVTGNLYVFWAGYPTANHIYYSEYSGSSWSSPVSWITESTSLTATYDLTCFYEAYGTYMGVEYMTATSSPYNVRFAFLQMAPTSQLSDSGITYSTTIGGTSCTFSITASDTVALNPDGQYEFGTNITGSMVWTTPVNFTSTLSQTVTETQTLPASGNTVAFAWDLSDNAGNTLDTGTTRFLVVPATFSFAEAGITSASPDTDDQKPAVINGNNYIVASTGGSFQETHISVYSATSSWAPSTELATTSTSGWGDFYVFTYPSVLPNTIIICGNYQADMYGFIMEFNTVSNTFTNSEIVTDTGYVTQVYYISNLNEFVITEAPSGSSESTYTNYIVTCAPSNLFNQANWAVSSQAYYDAEVPQGHEHRFCYDAGTGYGYFTTYASATQEEIWQINMQTWAGSVIWSSAVTKTIPVGTYISSDGVNVYFSAYTQNAADWDYYVYNGYTFTMFASLPVINDGQAEYSECHADIFPLGNGLVLIGDTCDTDTSGYYAIYQNLVQIASFVGPDTHFSDNHLVVDSLGNIVIGGEDDTGGIQAELTVITPSNILTNTITASNDGGSTISPSGSVNSPSGSTQTFTISPDSGYTISEVVVNDMNQGALTSYTFPDVSGSATISVISEAEATVSITFTSSPATGSGFITINGVAETTPYTISAAIVGATYAIATNSPANTVSDQSQYTFVQWSSTSIGTQTSQSYTYTVPAVGETVTASFQLQYYLTVNGGNGVTYGTAPTEGNWYNSGISTTVSSNGVYGRSSGTGQRVASWNIDGGSNTDVATAGTVTTSSVSMSTYHTVNFNSVTQYQVTLDAGATAALSSITSATVSGDNYWYDSGTSVTLTLNGVYGRSDGSGTRVSGYNVNAGSNNPESTTSTFTVLNAVSINGIEAITTTTVTQYQVTLDSGATSALSSITSPTISGDNYWYDSGTSVSLVLNGVYGRSGGSGTRVSGYEINAGSNNPETTVSSFTVLNALSISAVQAVTTTTVTQYQVTLDATSTSALYSITSPTVSGDNYWYDSGTSVSVVLNGVWDRSDGVGDRLAGYVLNGGSNNPTSTTGTVTVFSGAISNHEFLTATSVTQYQLTLTANFGSVSPATGGWYDADSSVTLSATAPSAGSGEQYVWNGWSGSGSGSYTGTDNPATNEVTMNAPITEAASWTHQYQIVPSADSNSVISPSSSVWVNAGDSQTFTYSPNAGYSILNVLVDGSNVSITGSYTFPDVTEAHSISVTSTLMPANSPISLSAGWNQVSFSVIPSNPSFSSILSGISGYQVSTWTGTNYTTPTSAVAGQAYWIFVPTNQTVSITGTSSTTCTVDLQAGWNMIGSVYGQSIAASSVISGYYQLCTWTGTSYQTATTIDDTQGYWVLVLQATDVTL